MSGSPFRGTGRCAWHWEGGGSGDMISARPKFRSRPPRHFELLPLRGPFWALPRVSHTLPPDTIMPIEHHSTPSMTALRAAIGLALIGVARVRALDNGLVQTPWMGWSAWETFRCTSCEIDAANCLSENLIRETTDAMVSKGFRDAGQVHPKPALRCLWNSWRPRAPPAVNTSLCRSHRHAPPRTLAYTCAPRSEVYKAKHLMSPPVAWSDCMMRAG